MVGEDVLEDVDRPCVVFLLVVEGGHLRDRVADPAGIGELLVDLLIGEEGVLEELRGLPLRRLEGHRFVALADVELAFAAQRAVRKLGDAGVEPDRAQVVLPLPLDVGLLEHRLVDERARRELGEQPLAHAEREVEFVHREVDPPQLDVGFLQQLPARAAGFLEDLLAGAKGLGVFQVRFFIEAELLVVVAHLGQRRRGADLGFQAELLVGDVGARHPDLAEVAFDDPCLRGPDQRAFAEMAIVEINEADELPGLAGEGAFGGFRAERDGGAEQAGLVGFPQGHRKLPHQQERVDLLFQVRAVGGFCQLSGGDPAGEFLVDLVRCLAPVDLQFGGKLVAAGGEVVVGIGDQQVDRLAEHRRLDVLLVGAVGDAGVTVADHRHLAGPFLIGRLVGGVGVDVARADAVAAADFEDAVAGHRRAERGGDGAEGDPRVAAGEFAGHGFLVAALGGAADHHLVAVGKDGQVAVVDLDVEPLAGFHLVGPGVLGGKGGADFLQRLDGPAVVAEFEVAEADVVVGVVDPRGGGEAGDHVAHDGEALAVVGGFVKAGAGLEVGVGAAFVVCVRFHRGRLVVETRLVGIAEFQQQVVGEPEVGLEADLALRVAFDHRLPDFQRLLVLAEFEPGVAGLQ